MKNLLLTLSLLAVFGACQPPPQAEKKETVAQEAPASTDTLKPLLTEEKKDTSDKKTSASSTVASAKSTPSPSKPEASNPSKPKTEVKKPTTPPPAKPAVVVKAPTFEEVKPILQKYTCMVCHSADKKIVGPAYKDVAKRGYSNEKIVQLIAKPEPSNWPAYPPMAPLPQVPKGDALKMAAWINSLK